VKKTTPTKSVTSKATRPIELKKATGTGRTLDQFRLRLPNEMREKLVEAAMANGRSLNDEIIYRLMQTVEREETRKKLSDSLKSRGDRLANVEIEIATLVEQLRLCDD
jgi:Arc-like DNA binding domain